VEGGEVKYGDWGLGTGDWGTGNREQGISEDCMDLKNKVLTVIEKN
jgi:hypothetical protein